MRKGDDIEITKDIYDRAMANRRYIAPEDMPKLFTKAQLCGYGVYSAMAYEKDGKYYCSYCMGSTCD